MAVDTNPPLLTAQSTGLVAGVLKVFYLIARTAAGGYTRGLWRAFGGPTATNGTDTTSPLMHLAVAETYDDAWQVTQATIGTTSSQVLTTALANRKRVLMRNLHATQNIFAGTTTSVLTTTGYRIGPGQEVDLPLGPNLALWLIADAAGTGVALVELA